MTTPTPRVRKKKDVTVSLSPYLKTRLDYIVDNDEDFTSMSDLATIVFTEFIVKYNLEKENISITEIFLEMLQTPEGKRLFDKILANRTKEHTSAVIEDGNIKYEDQVIYDSIKTDKK